MGVSTDGELSYGFLFEEGFEFPWDANPFNGDTEKWWMHVNGYENPFPCPYDERGNYKPGVESGSQEIKDYLDHQFTWLEKNPFPVHLVNYCSYGSPMFILSVWGFKACRGYPLEIDPADLEVPEPERKELLNFVEKYGIETDGEPKWWLSSFWG